MKAIHLQVEYLTNPLGLGNPHPRFYWQVEGGITQTAYQIRCRRNGEEIWDTGKVVSSKMTHIPYKGPELQSRDQIIWTVTLWDEAGQAGETGEAWFEMGLLNPADWQAQWISGDYVPKKKERYPVDYFRKQFAVTKEVKSARIYATARGVYALEVNGTRLRDFLLAPGVTDYRKRIQYQTYDVTSLLKEQDNTLDLLLGDGWYRGSVAAYGATNVYGTVTSALVQMEVTYMDGTRTIIATDGSWQWSNDGPIRFADLKDGEIIQAAMTPRFSGLAKVVEGPKDVLLVASDNVPVTAHEELIPELLMAQDGTKVLDFRQNIAGILRFTVQGKPGQVLKLRLGEVLDERGHVDQSGIQETKPASGWNSLTLMKKLSFNAVSGPIGLTPLQEIRFVCSGGVDTYESTFTVLGFQYAEVTGDVEIRPENFRAIAIYSDMEQTGTFTCSNEKINQLFSNTVWSMKGNFLDVPTDCPTRERLGWTGDAQIFFNTGAYLMNIAPFFRKWLQDMEDAQYKEGYIPSVLPYNGVEMMYKMTGASVGWADAIYLIPYRYYLCYGDAAILKECWPMMKKYTDYLLKRLGLGDKKAAKANPYNAFTYEKGIHLGEWLEPEEFQEKISASNRPKHPEEATAYLYLTMTTMAEIADILGKTDEAKKFRVVGTGAQKAYDYLFVKTGTLDTDRQAKIVRPLALGLLEGEEKAKAEERLEQAVENFNYRVGTGFLSTPFVLPVLTEAGKAETAYKMLENTQKPGWLYEVEQGATTVWESWEGDVSRNHYSPGAVCEWLFSSVAGIRVAGENHFEVIPIPGGSLTEAAASYQSLYGTITSQWKKVNGKTVFEITVPANTTADITLTNGRKETVTAGNYTYEITTG